MTDHYRTLGVSPNAEDVVIRAAYLALMRRYHPDQNPSAEAAEQAKRISAAYSVLGEPGQRADYDRRLAGRAVPQSYGPVRSAPRGRGAFAVMVLAAIGLLYFAITRPQPPLLPAATPRPAAPAAQQAAATGPESCSGLLNPAELRRALFREAEGLPAADPAAFRTAALSASAEVVSLAPEGNELLGNLRCRASISLRLPDGVATAGGSSSLLADVWFKPELDAANGPLLIEADEIVAQTLLSLARIAPPAPLPELAETQPTPLTAPSRAPIARRTEREPTPVSPAAAPPPRPTSAPAKPREPTIDLAGLERHGTLLYQQSYLAADQRKREQLMSSRATFLSRLESCSTDRCRRDQHLRRNQEIAAIMGS